MNGLEFYKIIKKSNNKLHYEAKDLYLILLGNPNKTVYDIFLNTPKDKNKGEIYLQAQILFNLGGKVFKKLFNKGIIRSDPDQSDIVRQEYEECTAEKPEKKSDRSIPIWVKVSEERFHLIKELINKSKDLGTTIDNKR